MSNRWWLGNKNENVKMHEKLKMHQTRESQMENELNSLKIELKNLQSFNDIMTEKYKAINEVKEKFRIENLDFE